MKWVDKGDHIECPSCGRWWEKSKNETYRFNCCPCCGAELVDSTENVTMADCNAISYSIGQPKDEPQTDCDGCKHSNTEKESDECYGCSRYYTDNYEPQAEEPDEMCRECKHWEKCSKEDWYECHYEPQTENE